MFLRLKVCGRNVQVAKLFPLILASIFGRNVKSAISKELRESLWIFLCSWIFVSRRTRLVFEKWLSVGGVGRLFISRQNDVKVSKAAQRIHLPITTRSSSRSTAFTLEGQNSTLNTSQNHAGNCWYAQVSSQNAEHQSQKNCHSKWKSPNWALSSKSCSLQRLCKRSPQPSMQPSVTHNQGPIPGRPRPPI